MKTTALARTLLLAGVILTAGSGCSSLAGGPLPDTIEGAITDATAALARHDVDRMERVLQHAEGLEGPEDKAAEIQRLFAVVEWKYHARFDAARRRLIEATERAEPDEAWIALARLESSRQNHAAALDAARRALPLVESPQQQVLALTELGRAAVGQALHSRRKGQPIADTDGLVDTFERLHAFVQDEPGYLQPSRYLLQAALLLDRGEAALLAWRSYFHVAGSRPAPGAIADAGVRLAALLPGWPDADKSQHTLSRPFTGSTPWRKARIA